MDKTFAYKPGILDIDPNSANATREWRHWKTIFTNYTQDFQDRIPNQLRALISCVSSTVFEFIETCEDIKSALERLDSIYIKKPNEIFARHLLATRKQGQNESIDEFFQSLERLRRDCNFKDRTAKQIGDEAVRDAFICGILSTAIRQRLLENKDLDLRTAYDQASTLDLAQKTNASVYTPNNPYVAAITPGGETASYRGEIEEGDSEIIAAAPFNPNQQRKTGNNNYNPNAGRNNNFQRKARPYNQNFNAGKNNACFFCGVVPYHKRSVCPAREVTCFRCATPGHYAKLCRSIPASNATIHTASCISIGTTKIPSGLSHAATSVTVGDRTLNALIDSGASENFINDEIAKSLSLKIFPLSKNVSMAQSSFNSRSNGYVVVDFKLDLNGKHYTSIRLTIMENLCCDFVLGWEFQSRHKKVTFEYGGDLPELIVKSADACFVLKAADVTEPTLFPGISMKCRPIATKSRRFSEEDNNFIVTEVEKLLQDEIIEPSISPWRAQVVVVKDATKPQKKRLCVDYSQTINIYTEQDAFPLPRISDLITKLAKYKYFSTFDLKTAYHQIKIKESDKKFTAFEANGQLFQFTRLPFGVTNGVPAFQRAMNNIVKSEKLIDTFPYLDNVIIGGETEEEHDKNVENFLKVVKERDLTLNDSKTIEKVTSLNTLGYCVGQGKIKPDPERMKPLQELPLPTNMNILKRVRGMFAYYAKWIPEFSDKIQPLVTADRFPLGEKAQQAFNTLKSELCEATLWTIDENLPLQLESDASDYAISAVLSQSGRPVAFMSRSLQASEKNYNIVEKEALAIIEAVRKWKHLLSPCRFKLYTDARSVSFMYDNRRRTKVKNAKINEWRMELGELTFDIEYRPGKNNVAADTFSRTHCASINSQSSVLVELHEKLCHPGVSRLVHFIRSRNLPFSTEDVKRTCASCKICAELKPRFYRPTEGTLIRATGPMQRLSIDFKGPLPTASRNPYLLVIVDEYSRFPFLYSCPDMQTSTVIKCLELLFSMCGMPDYLHSDRGRSFISRELKEYLLERGVATSNSTPYHPQGNGQAERYVGIVWKAIQLALKSHKLSDKYWELVLPQVLHSIRSLLCTATNCTPHERFFQFQRRTSHGNSLPSWLMNPGPVLLRRFVRTSKSDPLVDKVDLIDSNRSFACIRYPDGRESTVSVQDLAPYPTDSETLPPQQSTQQFSVGIPDEQLPVELPTIQNESILSPEGEDEDSLCGDTVQPLRRSNRVSVPPKRYGWE